MPAPVEAVAGFPALGGADRVMITRAFESLPDRWQVPLWHTTVLGGDVAALAEALAVPGSVAAPLARYAGSKLRQAFLQAHLDAAPRPACEPHRERLTAHLRGALDAEASDGVRDHLSRCDSCRDLVAALDTVEELLARSVVPFFPAAAGRSGVPRPLGLSGSVAVVEVTGDTLAVPDATADVPAGAAASDASGVWDDDPPEPRWRRLVARLAPAGSAQPDEADPGSPDGDGGTDDRDPGWWRGRGPATTVGGAAAATVLVAGLAVFGTAMVRDDGDPSGGAALADDTGGTDEDGDDLADPGSGDDDRRAPGDKDDTGSTTTVPEDERPDPDESEDEPPEQRPVSAVRPSAERDGAGQRVPAAPRGSSPPAPGPTTTSTPPTTAPPPDPELASWTVGWAAGSGTGGTLTVTVTGPAGADEVETAPVLVTIDLSGGAHVADAGGGCEPAGQRVTCTVPAPAAGEGTSVAVGVTVDGPGETATVSARQAGTALGSAQTVNLEVAAAQVAADESADEAGRNAGG